MNKKYIILIIVLLLITIFMNKCINDYSDKIFNNPKLQKIKLAKKEKLPKNKLTLTNISKYKNLALIDNSKLTKNEKEILISKISKWILNNYPMVYKRLAYEISNYLVNSSQIPLLMIGLIGAESSFRVQLKNSLNAIGLCQVRYFIWKKEAPDKLKEYEITSLSELYDPLKNMKLGEYILLKYLKETGDITKALVRYQTGKDSLEKLSQKQKVRTVKYINKVFSTCGKAYVYISLK